MHGRRGLQPRSPRRARLESTPTGGHEDSDTRAVGAVYNRAPYTGRTDNAHLPWKSGILRPFYILRIPQFEGKCKFFPELGINLANPRFRRKEIDS